MRLIESASESDADARYDAETHSTPPRDPAGG